MKTTFLKTIVQISWLSLVFVISCQRESINNQAPASMQAQAEMTAHDNSEMVAVAQDAMNATGSALASKGISSSNRQSSSNQRTSDFEIDCSPNITSTFTIDRSHADSIIYSGILIIDYGTGSLCTDSTEIKKGKLIDAFKLIVRVKDSVAYHLTESVTFQGYQKDSVKVDGIFTSTSTSDATSVLTIQNAKITYADGTFVSWSGTLTNQYIREGFHERDQESRQVTGSISGVNRTGTAFSASITKAILFEYSCSRDIPVAGTVDLIIGSVTSTIDYGAGTCDKDYTITAGGTTTSYIFKRHHHA